MRAKLNKLGKMIRNFIIFIALIPSDLPARLRKGSAV